MRSKSYLVEIFKTWFASWYGVSSFFLHALIICACVSDNFCRSCRWQHQQCPRAWTLALLVLAHWLSMCCPLHLHIVDLTLVLMKKNSLAPPPTPHPHPQRALGFKKIKWKRPRPMDWTESFLHEVTLWWACKVPFPFQWCIPEKNIKIPFSVFCNIHTYCRKVASIVPVY